MTDGRELAVAGVKSRPAFSLRSSTISNGGRIPDVHAGTGSNRSPGLFWSDPPDGTAGFALVLEDVDAPQESFRLWAVYNIPREHRRIPEGGSSGAGEEKFRHGLNAFGRSRYDGPKRTEGGRSHTFRFRLAALTTDRLPVPDDATADEVWQAARENLLAEAELIATFP